MRNSYGRYKEKSEKHCFGGEEQLYRVKILLNDLVEYAYPHSPKQKAYKAFYVEYINKKLKSKHGDYNPKNRHIRVFNLSRTEDQLVVTSVHELAHHINFIDDTSHSFKPQLISQGANDFSHLGEWHFLFACF